MSPLTAVDWKALPIRPRDEHQLTNKGWDLRNVLIAVREWGNGR